MSHLNLKTMKKVVLTLSLIVIATAMFSQNKKYYESMGENLQLYATAQTADDFQKIANQFELIANVEKTEWLPLYYAAHTTILRSFIETDKTKIDAWLDEAQKFIDSAIKIKKDESELYVMQGYLYLSRIGVDPVNRGQKYSYMAIDQLEKAKALNPENPRIFYLRGQNTLNTPEAFGGGKQNALKLFELAKEKFDTFKPVSQISPNWGNKRNLKQIELCKK